MKIKELVYRGSYSIGRNSARYEVIDPHMWHAYTKYTATGSEVVYGPGKNTSGYYTGQWGVPCLVYNRDGSIDDRWSHQHPRIINPKDFVGEWYAQERLYEQMDKENAARKAAREAELAVQKSDAQTIVDTLKELGVTGLSVPSYGSPTITIGVSQLSHVASVLTNTAENARKLAQQQTDAFRTQKQKEYDELVRFNEEKVATTLAENKQVILDLLYELDVTWEQWFGTEEVVIPS